MASNHCDAMAAATPGKKRLRSEPLFGLGPNIAARCCRPAEAYVGTISGKPGDKYRQIGLRSP